MPAPIQRTSVLVLYGKREELLARYGSMTNAYRVMSPVLRPAVSRPHQLKCILDNEPCRPDQVKATEAALERYLDLPNQIADRLLDAALAGDLVQLTVDEAVSLRDALCVPDEENKPTLPYPTAMAENG